MNRRIILTVLLFCVTLFVPFSLFTQDFVLLGTVLVQYRGNAEHVTIPASVTSIGLSAFSRCENLRTIVVSRRTAIGNNAFPEEAEIRYSD